MRASLFIWSLVFSLGGLSACATTTGQGWVREPVNENADNDAVYAARDLEPMPQPVSQPAPEPGAREELDASHPRLSHVVSLGESESAASPPAPGAVASAQPGVVVNVHNYVSTPYASAYGYGYAPSARVGASHVLTPSVVTTRTATSGGTPALGGDWGRSPSYGPTFPWHTGPASPWERPR